MGSFSSEHFTADELACSCCNKFPADGIDDALLSLLEDLRKQFGPLTLNDVYRCPKHNEEVHGVPGSYHIFGQAADIDCSDRDVDEFADAAVALGADGVGRYPNFVHVDVREGRTGAGYAWDYR